MVQVFKQRVSEGFEWVFPVDDADYEVFRGFDGTSRLGSWRPISMQLGWEVDDDNPPYRPAAMPWMGTDVLFLKREAVEVLGDALSQWGELLPLQNDETDLYVFNALYSLPALDEEHSDIVRFESGRIMMVDRYRVRSGRHRRCRSFQTESDAAWLDLVHCTDCGTHQQRRL